eukprot:TRINITY_DN1047_c0_g1_i1.p1 TRINITY_DN1047_c0_g1~~TRINITY_DN1047_c0_g1_i1.p1  ORF type:complete len:374 (-),score=55.76 TRINITY_DN1047_c0_g1_i1:296-1417(-)
MGATMCHHAVVDEDAHALDYPWRFHFRSGSNRDKGTNGFKEGIGDKHQRGSFRSHSVNHSRGEQNQKRHKHHVGPHFVGRQAKNGETAFRTGFQFHYRIELNGSCPHGKYAAVASAIDLQTSKDVAVKIISKLKLMKCSGSPGEDVKVEVRALRTLKGMPNVVQFIDAYEDADFFYIVMEYLKGGTLLEYVKSVGHLGEDKTASLLRQMLNILTICHQEGISHRDLKLENFLFSHSCSKEGQEHSLKLVDFGSAGFFKSGDLNPFKASVGTPFYMAPEIISGASYGPPADVWSLGVTAYSTLCGQFPFCAASKELNDLILHQPVTFSSPVWEDVSDCAKDLLLKMLDKDPYHRISASQALLHPWVQKNNPPSP